jgi:YVTN family beta-propeller protein
MLFGLLGPLQVSDDHGRDLPLGGRKQRAVLAILLLRANEVVSTERLIEELWAGEPPATAAKSLQVHISRLRSALANGGTGDEERIATAIGGYQLRVAPGELDADRFQRLVADGAAALEAGSWELASKRFRDALGLWRGRPLSDFEYDSFAQAEIARLAELRVAASEQWIEAELALGHEAAVIGELERLVREHPYRERLRGQLMLALYRSGRQADALAAYRDTRSALVEELGIEPSAELRRLHEAILAQDRSLLGPSRHPDEAGTDRTDAESGGSGVGRRRAHRRAPVTAVVGIVALGAVAAGLLAMTASGGSGLTVNGNSVALINPGSNRVVRQIAVGSAPDGITAGAGGIWVANTGDHSISQINPVTRRVVHTAGFQDPVDGVAADGGTLWTVDSTSGLAHQIDPTFGTVRRTIHLASIPGPLPSSPMAIAVGGGSGWFGNSAAAVIQTSARTSGTSGKLTTAVGNHPSGIALGAGAAWVTDDIDDTVSRVDPGGGVAATIPVGRGASGIAFGDGAVWVADTLDNTLVRIDPGTNSVTYTIPVGRSPGGVAFGRGSVWVANSGDGTVSRIDPRTDHVTATIRVGQSPQALVVSHGTVWVTVQSEPASVNLTSSGPPGVIRVSRQRPYQTLDPPLANPVEIDEPQLLYETCATLLTYPDRAGTSGERLVPDVAQALPTVSANGLTYTFRIRSGFRFSPPSDGPVTAATFKHTIDRVLSPKMGGYYNQMMGDIVGLQAYASGRATQLAGVTARGDELKITLTHPTPDLPVLLATLVFCAVPDDTPNTPQSQPIPMAGPYYIASSSAQQLVLARNPNYGGTRPRGPREIVYTFGSAYPAAEKAVVAGRSDYVSADQLALDADVPSQPFATLERRYGPFSRAARAGRQQYFVNPTLSLNSFALNTSRPLFASTRLRQAVNYAIDRQALAQVAGPVFGGQPLSHYLPPGMPGSVPAAVYPLGQPDLAKARALAAGVHATATMDTCNTAACIRVAQILQQELAAIGLTVNIEEMSVPTLLIQLGKRGAPWDIAWENWEADYPDPADFLSSLFDPAGGADASRFSSAGWVSAIRHATTLSGENRLRNYGRLDLALARGAAPVVAWSTEASSDLFSARIGCETYQPIYGMDLGALCNRT